MIDLQLKKFCNGCPNLAVEQETTVLVDVEKGIETIHKLKCANVEQCEHIYRYLKSKLERENENGRT